MCTEPCLPVQLFRGFNLCGDVRLEGAVSHYDAQQRQQEERRKNHQEVARRHQHTSDEHLPIDSEAVHP